MPRTGSRSASWPRACPCGPSRRSSRSAASQPSDRPRSRTHRPTAPGLQDLAGRLSDRLETRVRVELGRSKGKLTIEFGSLDDLHRIVGVIDPQPLDRAVEADVAE